MKLILGIIAILQIISGVLTAIASQSAIHQILAALVFGFGVLTLAIIVLIAAVERLEPVRVVRNPQSRSPRDDHHRSPRREALPSDHSRE